MRHRGKDKLALPPTSFYNKNMSYYKHEILGSGKPNVAIVACTHGDEPVGKKVLTRLKKIKINRGTLHLIVANPLACQRHRRFIKQDLNRSFPGKSKGNWEEKIAYQLTPILKKMDYVIDIHGTNSNFNFLAILVKLTKKNREILKCLPGKKTAMIKQRSLSGKPLISACPNSISLEYGPSKNGKNYPRALVDIKIIIKKLKLINQANKNQKKYTQKELFIVNGNYPVPPSFKQNDKLHDFRLIKKGDFIGYSGKRELYSKKTFYPIFLGRGRYHKLLALTAIKKNYKI